VDAKSIRRRVPRSSFGEWQPAAERAPLELLAEQERQRLQHLVPLRWERMAASPFAFYRGSAIVMASDLATLPVTGIDVQLCGDAHIANFGVYASPERNLVFDLNDFDETAPGPWEWDVLRMATSVVLAARERAFSKGVVEEAVRRNAGTYRETMRALTKRSPLEIWYECLDTRDIVRELPAFAKGDLKAMLERGKERTGEGLVPKLTAGVPPRFIDEPPTFVRIDLESEAAQEASAALEMYRSTLPSHVRVLFDRYSVVDAALKVVGVGSVGTRCLVVLHVSDGGHALLLQVKEAQRSVVSRFTGVDSHEHQGERVVYGQRLMQATSDVFLGWTHAREGVLAGDYYVRQLRDMKISVNLSRIEPEAFVEYAAYCGRALASAHARSGNPGPIAEYLGRGSTFEDAAGRFAHTYAGLAEADYELFCASRAPVAG
jgi:uncharacterized protein (DUF2252 family)